MVSGAAGQAIGHPLDTLKVHAQAAHTTESLRLPALWRGAMVPMATAGSIQSLALGVFENVRRRLWPHEHLPTPLPALALSGSLCGLTVSLLTCPLSRIKVLQQLTGKDAVTVVRALRGSRTLFRAFPTAALWEGTRGSYMVIYAVLKRRLHGPAAAHDGGTTAPPLPLWARMLAGGGANVLNFGLWYPLNTVLHVQQAELPSTLEANPTAKSSAAPASRGIAGTGQALLAEGGVARLYRGFGYAMLRAGPVAAAIMPCFELLLPWMERASVLRSASGHGSTSRT